MSRSKAKPPAAPGLAEYNQSVETVANNMGLSQSHLRVLLRTGQIPSIQVGRTYWMRADDVQTAMVQVNAGSRSRGQKQNSVPEYDLDGV